MNMRKQFSRGLRCLLCAMMALSVLTLQTKGAEKVNLAYHKPVTSSKIEGNSYAANAVDGNLNTYWASVNPSELEIDLEGYYKLSEINLMAYFAPSTGAVDRSYEYEIYGSIDQQSYTLLAENKEGKLEAAEGTTYTINQITARYIKVKILKTNAVGQPQNNTGHIKEISVYGEADPAYQQPDTLENVAKGKDAYSTENESGHGAAMAIDGNKNTYWASGHPTFLEVDLEGYYDVEEINLLAYFNDKRYYNYEIYTSLDGMDYQKIGEKKDTKAQSATGETYHFDTQTIRYVRVNMLSNSANPSVHISELSVMGVENTEYVPPVEPEDKDNLAKNKPARSYSNDASHPASAINDGDNKTFWSALYYPGYVDIDLEQNYQLNKIQVLPSYMDMSAYYQYTIYGSMDGSTFYKIAEKQDKEKVSREGNVFDISDVEARVIRVYMEYCSKGNTGSINEVKVYGKASDTAKEERPNIEVTDFKDSEYATAIDEQESIEAAKGVLARTIGAQYLDWFDFVLEENAESDLDYYELRDVDGKIQITGNKGLSLTTGLNYYLKYYCDVSITQQAKQVKMPTDIVPVGKVIRKETPYEVRYAYNYCTHSYTMAFWGETQWQNELDYLALNGFNAILDITGQEEVWRRFLGEIGYNNDEIKDWLVGPSYYGWQFMANMENVNGPIPDSWFADRTELARKNQRQMRALGMTPILQGYSGMVPNSIQSKDANAEIIAQGLWNGMQRPAMLKTTSDTFVRYAEMFYRAQEEVYGDVSNYYATDPFHEGGNPGGIGRDIVGRRVLDEMKKADSDAIWVIQSWSFQPALLQNITAEEKVNNILLLDLNGTKGAKYSSTNEFASSNWVYCMLENYGGRSGMAGNLEKYTHIPSQIKNKTNYMTGIGIAPEGTNNNPVKYDLFLEMMWEKEDIDLKTWIKGYVKRRYGTESENAQRAWELFLETTYLNTSSHADPPESIINARPQFNATKAAPNGNTNIHYSKKKLEKAVSYLMEDYDTLKDSDGYLYDVTDFLRQLVANSAQEEYLNFTAAFDAGDSEEFKTSSEKFLNMVRLQDEVLNANTNFMVGTWLDASKQASVGQDEFTQDRFSMNAKAMVSSWAPYYCWGVYDYANREYGGLTKDYYLKRWEIWINRLNEKLAGKNVSTDFTTSESHEIAWEWARSDQDYPTEATGDLKTLYETFENDYALSNQTGDATLVDQLDIKISTDLPAYSSTMGIDKAIDGNPSTIWSSAYGDLEPYDVYFEFNKPITINKFAYLPRPNGGNGNILGVELYVSDDGKNYTKMIAQDVYANNGEEKITSFEAVQTKYVKLHITDFLIYDNKHEIKSVTAAEFNFYKPVGYLSSDVYLIEGGKIAKVKENTTVEQFLKQVSVAADCTIDVLRADAALQPMDLVQEQDIVSIRKADKVVETYTIDALEKAADFTPLNELIKACEAYIESDYTAKSWERFALVLTTAIGVQVNPEATNEEILQACTELGEAAEQLVSLKELKGYLVEYENLKEEVYTPSTWALFKAAYQAGEDTLASKEDLTNEQVQNVLSALQETYAALQQKADPFILLQAILSGENKEAQQGLEETNTTASSWEAYRTALAKAQELIKDENATQDMMNDAAAQLNEAVVNLTRKASDQQLETLNKLIEEVMMLEADYAEGVFAPVKSAVEEAQKILDETQRDELAMNVIQNAFMSIVYAKDGLYVNTLLQALQWNVTIANALLQEDVSTIRPGQIELLKTAIANAQQLLEAQSEDEDAIRNTMLTLTNAMQALYSIVDKTDLIHLIDSCAMLHENTYTAASWNTLQQAIDAAKRMISNDDASKQEVEDSYLALHQAIINLMMKTDKSALLQQLAIADKMLLALDAYVPSTVIDLQEVVNASKAVAENETATQKEINTACNALIYEIAKARLRADREVLTNTLQTMRGLNLMLYTDDSAAAMQQAMKQAQDLIDNPEASQDAIDEALAQLETAWKQLSKKEEGTSTTDQLKNIIEKQGDKSVKAPGTSDTTKGMEMMLIMCLAGVLLLLIKKRKPQ